MSRVRIDKSKKRAAGIVLGLGAFEKISAIEGIRLTDEMRRDLRAFEQRGMSCEERSRFIMDKYGRKLP